MKRLAAMALGFLSLVLVASVAGAAPASAHSQLVSATPASGAELEASPGLVTLTFNEPVRDKYSVVQVTGPEGGSWQVGGLTQVGSTISQELGPLGPAGVYTVDWRVVSADGHPVVGTFTFTLTTAGDGKPQAAPGSTPAAGAGVSWWAMVGGFAIVALLLATGSIAVARRQGRARAELHG
ncbi:MAG: copper resistance CopC family protein [Cellulomonas sp.]